MALGGATTGSRLLGLDLLRVLAVFLVLGRHMEASPARLSRPWRWLFETWQRGGWVGVDLFFVLSGFLVSGLLFAEWKKRGRLSIGRFYVRRGWKIYPAFYTLIGLTVLVNSQYGRPPARRQVLSECLFVQNYFSSLWEHTWSLGVEEHFYLMLPPLLAALLWLRRGSADPFRPVPGVVGLVAAALLALRIKNSYYSGYNYDVNLMWTHLRVDSLFFGVAIAYVYHFHADWFRGVFWRWRRWLMAGGCAALIPAFVFQLEQSRFLPSLGLTLFYLGSGALLVGVLLSETPRSRVALALGVVGASSYSIYLWHMPVLRWGLPAIEHILSTDLAFAVRLPVYLLGSVAAGMVMARLIEFPALRLRERLTPAQPGPLRGAPALASGPSRTPDLPPGAEPA